LKTILQVAFVLVFSNTWSFCIYSGVCDSQKEKKELEGRVESKKQEEKEHFEAGVRFFMEKKFSKALEEFRNAYKLMGHWAIRFNIASCLMEMGKYSEATEELWLFLKEGGKLIEESKRQEAFVMIEQALKKSGRLEINVPGVDTELFIDDKKVELYGIATISQPHDHASQHLLSLDKPKEKEVIYLDPGVHVVEIKKGELVEWKSTIDVKSGEVSIVDVKMSGEPLEKEKKGEGEELKDEEIKNLIYPSGKGIYIKSFKNYRTGAKEKPLEVLLKERRISRKWLWLSIGGLISASIAATGMTIATFMVKKDLDNLYDEYNKKMQEGTIDNDYYNWAQERRNDLLDKGVLYTNVHLSLWVVSGFFVLSTVTLCVFTLGERKTLKGKISIGGNPNSFLSLSGNF